MAQSGIDPLAARLFELYLEVLQEDDAVLRSLSFQGFTHFVGVRMNRQESDKVIQTLLMLLQQPIADNVVEEINRFLCKSAEQNEWFVDQVVLQLLDIAISGKTNYLKLNKNIL